MEPVNARGRGRARAPSLAHALMALVCAGLPFAAASQAGGARPGAEARSADALADAARALARQDKNRESADLFEKAIRLAPQRRAEWLAEYADQLTYSQRPAQAVPLYREMLAAQPGGEQAQRLRKGLGLALLWSDQPGAAVGVYREIVRHAPADRDAQRNLGRALSWSGRQREAAAHLSAYLAAAGEDEEARRLLAQAQAWMGRTDLALGTLASAAIAHDDSRRLQEDLSDIRRPRTRVGTERSSQSDQLDIETWRLSHEVALADGRGMAGIRLERVRFERPDGSDSAVLERPMLLGRYRFDDAVEINAEVGQDRIDARNAQVTQPLVYATWLTVWPNDLLRFDLSASQSTFDNLRSLQLGLTARQVGLSMDFTPDERQRYNLKAEEGDYSDGNRRHFAQAAAEWRLAQAPVAVWAGLRHTRFAFAQQLNNGYFNPMRFASSQLTLRAHWRPGGESGRWDFSAQAAVGREHADPDGSKPAYDAAATAGWRLDRDTRLAFRLQRFSSRTGGLSGFARTTAGLALERAW